MASVVEWEQSKENVQPLKRGRVLAAAAPEKSVASASDDPLAAQRKKFEARVAAAVDARDSVRIWNEYVDWTKTAYPAGGTEAGTLQLLERATRAHLDTEALKNDTDYVKLWITYADMLPEPGDTFRFMFVNRIGLDVGLFYMAWAWLAEHKANYALADSVYGRGIARGATPADRLLARRKEFHRRAYRAWVAHLKAKERDEGRAPGSLTSGLPERLTDAIEASFDVVVDLGTLTASLCGGSAATAVAAAAAGTAVGNQRQQVLLAPPPTSVSAGHPTAPDSGSSSGARAPLGYISGDSAARSHRVASGPPQQPNAENNGTGTGGGGSGGSNNNAPLPLGVYEDGVGAVAQQRSLLLHHQQQQQAVARGATAASSLRRPPLSQAGVAALPPSAVPDRRPPAAAAASHQPLPQQPGARAVAIYCEEGEEGARGQGDGPLAAPKAAAPAGGALAPLPPATAAAPVAGNSRVPLPLGGDQWRTLPGEAALRKENSLAPAQWSAGGPLPQHAGTRSAVVTQLPPQPPSVGAPGIGAAGGGNNSSRVRVYEEEEEAPATLRQQQPGGQGARGVAPGPAAAAQQPRAAGPQAPRQLQAGAPVTGVPAPRPSAPSSRAGTVGLPPAGGTHLGAPPSVPAATHATLLSAAAAAIAAAGPPLPRLGAAATVPAPSAAASAAAVEDAPCDPIGGSCSVEEERAMAWWATHPAVAADVRAGRRSGSGSRPPVPVATAVPANTVARTVAPAVAPAHTAPAAAAASASFPVPAAATHSTAPTAAAETIPAPAAPIPGPTAAPRPIAPKPQPSSLQRRQTMSTGVASPRLLRRYGYGQQQQQDADGGSAAAVGPTRPVPPAEQQQQQKRPLPAARGAGTPGPDSTANQSAIDALMMSSASLGQGGDLDAPAAGAVGGGGVRVPNVPAVARGPQHQQQPLRLSPPPMRPELPMHQPPAPDPPTAQHQPPALAPVPRVSPVGFLDDPDLSGIVESEDTLQLLPNGRAALGGGGRGAAAAPAPSQQQVQYQQVQYQQVQQQQQQARTVQWASTVPEGGGEEGEGAEGGRKQGRAAAFPRTPAPSRLLVHRSDTPSEEGEQAEATARDTDEGGEGEGSASLPISRAGPGARPAQTPAPGHHRHWQQPHGFATGEPSLTTTVMTVGGSGTLGVDAPSLASLSSASSASASLFIYTSPETQPGSGGGGEGEGAFGGAGGAYFSGRTPGYPLRGTATAPATLQQQLQQQAGRGLVYEEEEEEAAVLPIAPQTAARRRPLGERDPPPTTTAAATAALPWGGADTAHLPGGGGGGFGGFTAPHTAMRPAAAPGTQRTVFKSVARNNRASIADPNSPSLTSLQAAGRHMGGGAHGGASFSPPEGSYGDPHPGGTQTAAAAAGEDVTINLRIAMEDVGSLFASPGLLRARQRQQEQQRQAAVTAAEEAQAAPQQQQQLQAAFARPAPARLPLRQQMQAAPAAAPRPSPPEALLPPASSSSSSSSGLMQNKGLFAGIDVSRIPPDARRLSVSLAGAAGSRKARHQQGIAASSATAAAAAAVAAQPPAPAPYQQYQPQPRRASPPKSPISEFALGETGPQQLHAAASSRTHGWHAPHNNGGTSHVASLGDAAVHHHHRHHHHHEGANTTASPDDIAALLGGGGASEGEGGEDENAPPAGPLQAAQLAWQEEAASHGGRRHAWPGGSVHPASNEPHSAPAVRPARPAVLAPLDPIAVHAGGQEAARAALLCPIEVVGAEGGGGEGWALGAARAAAIARRPFGAEFRVHGHA